MGVRFTVYMAIDDDTPSHEEPFSNDPSVWSLREDFALGLCGERGLFAALGYDPTKQFGEPLVALRGEPQFVAAASEVRRWLDGELYAGWLTSRELFAALEHANIDEGSLVRSVQTLFAVVRLLTSIYGDDRVRLIFAFIP